MARLNVSFRDYSDEYGNMAVTLADIDGVTRLWTTIDGEADGLVGHLEAHSLGTVKSARVAQDTQAENDTRPADPFAQREIGFRVYIRDNTTQELGYFTIPCADLDIGSVVAGKDELDLSASPTAGLVTYLETNVLSRDGNAITVERIVTVGRNN